MEIDNNFILLVLSYISTRHKVIFVIVVVLVLFVIFCFIMGAIKNNSIKKLNAINRIDIPTFNNQHNKLPADNALSTARICKCCGIELSEGDIFCGNCANKV